MAHGRRLGRRAVAALTHADPLAIDSCVIWSDAVRRAVLDGHLDLVAGLDLIDAERREQWRAWIDEATGANPARFAPNGFTVTALQAAWAAISSTAGVAGDGGGTGDDTGEGTKDGDSTGHVRRALSAAVRVSCPVTDPDIQARWRSYLAQQSDRGFGTIPLAPTAALSPFSRGQMLAASNLLDKALRALELGDQPRAQRLAERAAALPYDEHEEFWPGPKMAHRRFFSEVVDAIEDCEDHWVLAAADTLDTAAPEARNSLRGVLADVLQDYNLSDSERRRVTHLIRGIPEGAELGDRDRDLDSSVMVSGILEILRGILHFTEALDEIHDREHAED